MKQTIITILLALALTGWAKGTIKKDVLGKTKNSITFVVDKGLKPIEDETLHYQIREGAAIAKDLVLEDGILGDNHNILALSFADEKSMHYMEKDAFFRTIKYAYEKHKGLVLSPDMIWLAISQGFARYVNAHPDEMRHQMVGHEGQMDLVVQTHQNVLKGNANWDQLVNEFAKEIAKYTKEDIAQTLTANFTTTMLAERVASQITLMESVKTYFRYIVMRISCGIPHITLTGTPEDWQKVLDKTRKLDVSGLEKWTKSLEPILTEFILTAKGQPNAKFWKGIVKKQSIKKLEGGACSFKTPTQLDGWFLKLFPNEEGKTLDEIYHTQNMPAEYVRVPLKYVAIDSESGDIDEEAGLELWAGFVGAIEDTLKNTVIPKIGWIVRRAESDQDVYDYLSKVNEKRPINLRVQQVPLALSRIKHIKSLMLEFTTDDVELPEWMENITINEFCIYDNLSEEKKEAIKKRFPQVEFRKW